MTRNVVLMLVLTGAALAQTLPDAGFGIGGKMKQNAEALKHYSYKRRTQITIKKQPKGARVDLVRYIDGKMETVPLETPARAAGQARGGLRGRIVEKRKEEMKEDVERLTGLLHRYVSSDSDSMHGLLEKAAISRTSPGPDADVEVSAKGLIDPKDSFTLVWSAANHRPVKVEIHAVLDGKPVQVTVDYGALPGGPFYAARTVISAPKKDIAITVDNFDYTLAGDAR